MGKTISTLLSYFLISFITSFFPEAFYLHIKKLVHNSVVPADGALAIQKWNFLTLA